MSVGTRLKEERQRLGFSQERLAGVVGVAKNTAINWEKDQSSPTASALIALGEAGADAVYILTGKRTIGEFVSEREKVEALLDEIHSYIIEPSLVRRPDEPIDVAEYRYLSIAKATLSDIISGHTFKNLEDDHRERSQALLDIIENPQKLTGLRAAAFDQRQRDENNSREGLEIWLFRCPYKPSDKVMAQLASITHKYGVAYEPLVKLLYDIHADIVVKNG